MNEDELNDEQETTEETVEAVETTPAAPAFSIPDDVKEGILAEAEARAYARLRAETQAPAPPPVKPQNPYDQAKQEAENQGIYDDAWVIARSLHLHGEQVRAQVSQEMDSRYGPQIARIRERDSVDAIAHDLAPEARERVRQFAAYLDPTMDRSNPLFQLVRGFAENEDRKVKETFRPETTRQEPQVRVNEGDFASYNRDYREAAGLPAISRSEYVELSKK